MKNKYVSHIALKDIAKDTVFPHDEEKITAHQLNTKENKILNKRLGLKNINYKARYEK